MVILSIFWYFLVHNFHKNQYFPKPISLLIYIFQDGSFEVSSTKNIFWRFSSSKGPPLVFENFDWKWEINISVREKMKKNLKSLGKTLSFAPWDEAFFWNNPNVHRLYIICRLGNGWVKMSEKNLIVRINLGSKFHPGI